MKIATRTALIYTGLTAGILLLFTYIILWITEKNQKDEFFDRLGYKITWRAEFYFDAGVEENVIRLLHTRNQKLLNEADISIYNQEKQLIFSDLQKPLGEAWVWEKLQRSQRVKWTIADQQYMAVPYVHKKKTYYIFGRAKDSTGSFYMNRLKHSLALIYCLSVAFIFIIGFLFSYYTLKPLKQIIAHIRTISEHQLNKRLDIPKAKDELYELTETFNSTFNRLEKSFNNHKKFVTTISHEFRTPLAALIAELQLAKELNVTIEDYEQSIDNALLDAKKATDLSTALLDLARASFDTSQISFVPLRLDEVVIDAKLNVISKNKNYKVRVQFEKVKEDEDAESLEFLGNPYLLQIAFMNLIENACKYSNNESCIVELIATSELFEIKFTDHGIGISTKDRERIFDLFYRGQNNTFQQGNGIGLSIVNQIISLHKGNISIDSIKGNGSVFTVQFPKFTP